ncbi:MAG: glycoside hydrolase family 15 protein [Candidatus Jordarchaeales archaeon]
MQVDRYVFALPEDDVVVFYFNIFGGKGEQRGVAINFWGHFRVAESSIGNAAFYDEEKEALVFYKKGYYFAVGGDRPVNEYSCFRVDERRGGGFGRRAVKGKGVCYTLGDVGGYLKWDLGRLSSGRGEVAVYICCGKNIDEAISLLNEKTKRHARKHLEEAISDGEKFTFKSKLSGAAVTRSLLAMRLLCDRGGGIIAAPEFDPRFRRSGGYRYVWGRDGAFVAYAFDIAGHHELSRKFYAWCSGLEKKNGLLFQRYCCDGTLASQWREVQLDETGTVLWGLEKHVEMTGDYKFLSSVLNMVEEMADGLASSVDERGLLSPCFDLWEERKGIHAYSTAAAHAGLESAVKMIEEVGGSEKVEVWRGAARRLRESFNNFFWNGKHFVRTLNQRDLKADTTPDSSLLGLAVPFSFVEPTNFKMRATAEWIEKELMRGGGVLRYKRDKYFGGNPWTVTTLWLALYKAELGLEEEAMKLAEWCLSHSNELGLLPEQVHRRKGTPLSATPLGWAHAFLVMFFDKLGELKWQRR